MHPLIHIIDSCFLLSIKLFKFGQKIKSIKISKWKRCIKLFTFLNIHIEGHPWFVVGYDFYPISCVFSTPEPCLWDKNKMSLHLISIKLKN